jgi:hypothetical protein
MFDFGVSKIDSSKNWVEVKTIYVCIHSCKSELNNKFECKKQLIIEFKATIFSFN